MTDLSAEWRPIDQHPIDAAPAVVLVIGDQACWRRMYPDETLSMIAQESMQPGMASLSTYRVEAVGDWENGITAGRAEMTRAPRDYRLSRY